MLTTASLLVIGMSTVAGVAMVAAFAAWAWKGWLDLKRCEIGNSGFAHAGPAPQVGNRIELADLRERVRKLEAIAAGVEI